MTQTILPGASGGMGDSDYEALRQRIAKLEQELADERRKSDGAKTGGSGDVGELPMAISEFEETLRRLVQRTAMIVQAEKCVILVRDAGDNPIGTVVIFNDVTDIRNVERMKTEFVSIVSHELRTPLTPMKGFVSMLLDDVEEDMFTKEDRLEFHQIINDNVDRLGRLINDLLNVSRIERMGAAGIEMNWEEVDIRKATEEVVGIQKGRTDKHTLVIDFVPETFEAETDPDKIQNILQNFVSNAIKYSPDGGEVRVIGRINEPKRPLEPADPLLEKGVDTVLIGVSDQGMGIPEHALKKLGEKFYRVDNKSTRKAGGTGIGLFLVKNLITRHNGYMWVESEVGKGSTFWFRFPRKQPEEEGKESGS